MGLFKYIGSLPPWMFWLFVIFGLIAGGMLVGQLDQ